MGPKCRSIYPCKRDTDRRDAQRGGGDVILEVRLGEAATSRGMPEATRTWKKQGTDSPESPERGQPC